MPIDSGDTTWILISSAMVMLMTPGVALNLRRADGLLTGNMLQFGKQFIGVAAVWVFAFGGTWVLAKLVDVTVGLRVSGLEETVGLDISQHGERAYGGVLR